MFPLDSHIQNKLNCKILSGHNKACIIKSLEMMSKQKINDYCFVLSIIKWHHMSYYQHVNLSKQCLCFCSHIVPGCIDSTVPLG